MIIEVFQSISVNPPSTVISEPTQYEESEDARNRAAFAISSALPNLFIGIRVTMFDAILARTSSDNPMSRESIGVSVKPGVRTFTLIPRMSNSAERVLARDLTADFAAL